MLYNWRKSLMTWSISSLDKNSKTGLSRHNLPLPNQSQQHHRHHLIMGNKQPPSLDLVQIRKLDENWINPKQDLRQWYLHLKSDSHISIFRTKSVHGFYSNSVPQWPLSSHSLLFLRTQRPRVFEMSGQCFGKPLLQLLRA